MTTKNEKSSALLKAMKKNQVAEVLPALDATEFPELGKEVAASAVGGKKIQSKKPIKGTTLQIAPQQRTQQFDTTPKLGFSGFASATKIFNDFVETILLNGGYLNSSDLANGLSGKLPELNKLESFRNIQNINRVVSSAISCYWYGRSIRTYHEMEQAVIGQVARYQKKTPIPIKFEEFGVGSLNRNETVIKLFGSVLSPPDIAPISSQDVVMKMFEFLRNNHRVRYPDDQAERQFHDSLRQQYRNLQGLNFEFKSLFHSAASARRDWGETLRQTKINCGSEYAKALKAAVEGIVMRRNPTRFAPALLERANPLSDGDASEDKRLGAHFLSSIGIDIRLLYTSLQDKLVVTEQMPDASTPYVEAAAAIVRHRGINKQAGLALGVIAALVGGSYQKLGGRMLQGLIIGRDVSEHHYALLERQLTNKVKSTIVSAVLGMLVYLINTQGAPAAVASIAVPASASLDRPAASPGADVNADATNDSRDVEAPIDVEDLDDTDTGEDEGQEQDADAIIRTWLDHSLVADVPRACLTHLYAFLKDLVDPQVFVSVETARATSAPVASLNWEHVRQQIELRLAGSSVAAGESARNKDKGKKEGRKRAQRGSAGADFEPPPGAVHLAFSDYIAVLTSCIIYHRILRVELLPPPTAASLKDGNTDDASDQTHLVSELVADTLLDTMNSAKLGEFITACQHAGPATAIIHAFRHVERAVTDKLCVPAFECARLGGSFCHFLQAQLNAERSGVEQSPEQKRLCDTVQQLYTAVVGTAHTPGSSSGAEDSGHAGQYTSSGEGYDDDVASPSQEQVLQAVADALGASVGAAEFDTGGDADTPAADSSALFAVLKIAQQVEGRLQEEGLDLRGSSSGGLTVASALHRVCAANTDLCARVEKLVSPTVLLNQGCDDTSRTLPANLMVQSRVSLEVAALALFQHASATLDANSFETLFELCEYIAHCLVCAFRCSEDSAQMLAEQLMTKLRTEGNVALNGTTGRVNLQLPSKPSAFLSFEPFATHSAQDPDRDDATVEAAAAQVWKNSMLSLLAAVPYGASCAEHSMWVEMSAPAPFQQSSSLLDFIAAHEALLIEERPQCAQVIYFVIPGTEDCIPLPAGTSREDLRRDFTGAIQSGDYAVAAAFCMAAALNAVETAYVTTVLNSHFLEAFESLGTDAVQRLAQLVLQIATALPTSCTATSGVRAVLKMCLDAIAAAAKISFSTAQQVVMEAALGMDARFRRFLAAVTRSNEGADRFPMFREYSDLWIASAFVVKTAALSADDTGSSNLPQELDSTSSATKASDITPKGAAAADTSATASQSGLARDSDDAKAGATAGDSVVSDKKAIILRLLQDDFGYTDGGRARPSVESSEGRKLQNALDLLSASLYSSQVHFVMELIQNADDNPYADTVVPTIRLELYPHAVLVYNNEKGFSQENIVAVCNVGRSTKAKQTGYIGQKGIGFKSVFSISDAPEIHSNGFHIGFNKQISMLEPVWLEPTATVQWPAQYDSGGTYYETCLRLKLDQAALKSFSKLNQDIQGVFNGKLILFLNKLQRMILEDRTRNIVAEHTRTRLSDDWWSICIDTTTPAGTSCSEVFWLVLKHPFAPLVRRVDVSVASTEVAIAFKFLKTGRTFKSTRKIAPAASAFAASTATVDSVTADTLADYVMDMDLDLEDGEIPRPAESNVIEYEEEIRLDFNEGLMPIYAYLPTSTCCFKFMVQGDFVLPTNRESILEQNEWNLGLMEQVPGLFVAAISEMSQWCELQDRGQDCSVDALLEDAEKFPVLSQLRNTKYRVRIDPGDILLALPRLHDTSKDYINTVVHSIYENLQEVRFLQSSTGVQCRPREIVAVHNLDFDPQEYISEELLLRATGCRYAMHETGVYELDDQLSTALGVARFDMACAVKCAEYLAIAAAAQAGESASFTSSSSSAGRQTSHLEQLAGVLLALEMLGRSSISQNLRAGRNQQNPPKHSTADRAKRIVPVQTIKASAVPHLSQMTGLATILRDNIRAQFRRLQIWPDATGTCHSLEVELMFLQSKQSAFSVQQQACLEVFKDRLRMLDPRLLDVAGKIVPRGADILSCFLLENFKLLKSPSGVMSKELKEQGSCAIGVSSGGGGGIEGLTADVVLTRVIFPVYRKFAAANPVPELANATSASAAQIANSEEAETSLLAATAPEDLEEEEGVSDGSAEAILDRLTAAAFLAFFYNSNWGNKLNVTVAGVQSDYARFVKDVGVVIPVLTAREKNNSLHFNNSALVLVKKVEVDQIATAVPAFEVHLGAEVPDSAVLALASPQTSTALRQMAWKVVDPTVASLALGVKFAVGSQTYSTHEISTAFRGASSEADVNRWKEFLLRLGVVNFFGVYQQQQQGVTEIITGTAAAKPSVAYSHASLSTLPAGVSYQAPHLMGLINHLLRNGNRVTTDASLVSSATRSSPKDRDDSDGDEDDGAHASAARASQSSASTSAAPLECLSVYVPSEEKALLRVTKEVHDAMSIISTLLSKEVDALRKTKASRGIDLNTGFLCQLRNMSWVPILLHPLLQHGRNGGDSYGNTTMRSTAPASTQACYVGTPQQIMANLDHKSYGGWGLGPHVAYLPHGLVDCAAFRELFAFPVLKRGDPPAELLVGYWKWLSGQENQRIWSQVKFMRYIFGIIQTYLAENEASNSTSTNAFACTRQVLEMLRADAPVIWIPDDAADVTSQQEYYPGQMVPLSRLVQKDPSEKLHVRASPIKSLAEFYSEGDLVAVVNMFSYKHYCVTCQAVQGMFGTTGGLTHFASAERRCSCTPAHGAHFCKLVAAAGRPVVRKSPGALDMALVLRHHCERLQELSNLTKATGAAQQSAVLSKGQLAALKNEQSDLRAVIGEILTALSLNIWKCFQIQFSLHPYSTEQLRQLKSVFSRDAILPTLECRSFVSLCEAPKQSVSETVLADSDSDKVTTATKPQARLQIALDDLDAFRVFETDLQALGDNVDWMEVHGRDSTTAATGATASPSLFVHEDQTATLRPYDIELLADEERELLMLPSREFESAVNTISPLTFFAPPNRLALLEFLGISKLSNYITAEWIVEKAAPRSSPAASMFVTVMNALLLYTHAYFFKTPGGAAMVDRLESTQRIGALLAMEVEECAVLRRKLQLKLADVSAENTQEAAFRRDTTTTSSTATAHQHILQLSSSIGAAEVQSLAVSLLMSAVRVEMALIEVRQDHDRMESLRNKLLKVAGKAADPGALQILLEFDDLDVVPAECEPWQLRVTESILHRPTKNESVEFVQGVDTTTASHQSGALDAYKQMQEASREKRKNASATKAPLSKAAAEKDAQVAAYLQAQQLQMKALGEAVTAQAADSTIAASDADPSAIASLPVAPASTGPVIINDDPVQHVSPPPAAGAFGITDGSSMIPASPAQHAHLSATPLQQMFPPSVGGMASHALHSEHHGASGREHQQMSAPTGPADRGGAFSGPSQAPGGTYTVTAPTRASAPFSAGVATLAAMRSGSAVDHGAGGGDAAAVFHPYQPGMAQTTSVTGALDVIYCCDIAEEDKIIFIPDAIPTATEADGPDSEAAAAQSPPEHPSSAVEDSLISKHQNFATGRIGEEVAVKQLRQLFAQQLNLSTSEQQGTRSVCTAVLWLNEQGECGLPYDIELQYADGSRKHCEVKTRSVPRSLASEGQESAERSAHNQWIMSPAEVALAHMEKDAYFCMFMNLSIDHASKNIELLQSRIVGYERGLVNAVYVDQAKLFLQLI